MALGLAVFVYRQVSKAVVNAPAVDTLVDYIAVFVNVLIHFGIKLVFKVSHIVKRAEKPDMLALCLFGIEMTVPCKT